MLDYPLDRGLWTIPKWAADNRDIKLPYEMRMDYINNKRIIKFYIDCGKLSSIPETLWIYLDILGKSELIFTSHTSGRLILEVTDNILD